MSRLAIPSEAERDRAHSALMNGIRVVEERIAPLWTTRFSDMTEGRRIVRARVTANGFRELDVLLAHWVGLVAMRPVRMAEIGDWREADRDDPTIFTAKDILRLAAEYRRIAPPLHAAGACELAA
ncbi:hypothetical protein [Sphingomonas sp. SORGH_AS_0879]|uniref:hypothetical protein n=1 Tax=Sphingomonas sp. SORGH_AS_0879 TaxID=3041790 RepID=UPI0027864D86|nr:hypothetical protein [Sphingomonas sp. SORGH_AS_0879]MDQ1231313.1 hypothetical protein [Sphingomonas sp. SORGH_AS_0879]